MSPVVVIALVSAGTAIGFLVAALFASGRSEDAARVAAIEFEALKRVHQENGALSQPTRTAVIAAIETHENWSTS